MKARGVEVGKETTRMSTLAFLHTTKYTTLYQVVIAINWVRPWVARRSKLTGLLPWYDIPCCYSTGYVLSLYVMPAKISINHNTVGDLHEGTTHQM